MKPKTTEQQLIARLARLLDDEMSDRAQRALQIKAARRALVRFYETGYYRFDGESKSLVPLDPASVKQDAWSYRG